jgi:nicotinamidase-related amidase
MVQQAKDEIDLNEIRGGAPSIYTEPLDPKVATLVIVDMQEAFCRPDPTQAKAVAQAMGTGPTTSYEKWMDATIANSRRLLEACREERLRIVHIVLGCWTEDGVEMSPHKSRIDERKRALGLKPRRQIDLPEFQIIPELAPRRGEIVLQKVTASAFTSTGLDCILRNMGVQYLIMSGTITHGCLGLTALDASDHGYKVTMVSDASIAPGALAGHKVWLRLFEQHWGRVRSTEEVIHEIRIKR